MTGLRLHRRALLQTGAGLTVWRAAVAAESLFSAEAFVDSVGVNVHLSSEPYASSFDQVRQLLARSGLRHLRDELPRLAEADRWRLLFDAHGLRANLLVSPVHNTVADILAYVRAVGIERLSALEGQNEGDSDWFRAQPAAKPDWASAVVDYQREVYGAVRALYPPDQLPVLSPSVLDYRPEDMLRLKDAAPFCDMVTLHSYVQHGQEPETGDADAAIGWYLGHMRDPFKPGAPAMSTETGYNNLVRPGGGVSETAAAIYLPRLLLTNFAAGVRRTFLYEFMDEGTSPDDSEQHWGLVRRDGTPKPAFHAIARLMQAMGEHDPGRSRIPPRLAAPGAGPDLRLMTFARPDGSALAAVWRAVRCWDPARAADVPVEPVSQHLTFGVAPRFCRSFGLGGGAGWRDHAPGSTLDLPVGPDVTLVSFG